MKTKKILTVLGARPQIIKSAIISNQFSKSNNIKEYILHTGQHFDRNMSQIFFDELSIPKPYRNLDINELNHSDMTAKMISSIDSVCDEIKPDFILVYGDTNSTLAGALVASKKHIPLAHVEAGLRSYNKFMPEEINRVITDRVSDILFCPTKNAKDNLSKEGFPIPDRNHSQQIVLSGDIMYDLFLMNRKRFVEVDKYDELSGFVLATIHRQENMNLNALSEIIFGLEEIAKTNKIIFPLHPATRKFIVHNFKPSLQLKNIHFVEPLSYVEVNSAISKAQAVITDSGGVQKEAYFHETPCITIRDETEWIETLQNNANILCNAERKEIINKFNKSKDVDVRYTSEFGNGNTADIIYNELLGF